MLKGAYLCAHYPVGFRTSSDVDLLVMPQDVTAVGRVLTENGFRQGYIRNGEFVPATRKEIIESKMTRGETVPYIKEVGLPFLRFLEVDVNFSWDYRGGSDGTLSKMLSRACIKQANGSAIPTLCDEDFFIHLCAHLYKEATTLPWIEMKRDMTLYKYCDVYTLLCEMHDEELDAILARARELGMEKICAYAILEASELFAMENTLAVRLSEQLLADHPAFRLSVVSPKEGRTLRYRTKNAKDRFFLNDRVADLWEVCDDATA